MAVRVLWVIKGLGPGGAERLLCAAAAAHDHERFDIHCVTVRSDKSHLADELVRAGVEVRCTARSRRDPMALPRLVRHVRDGGWDVVHVHSPLVGAVARLAVRTIPADRRPAVITTEHNTWASHRLPTRLVNRLTGSLSDATIAVDHSVAASMSGPATAQVEVLTHGIDVAAVGAHRNDRDAVRAELGIGADEVVVGTVANFRRNKDYPNLLRAIAHLRERGVAVRLVAVGQGPDADDIRALAAELGLDDAVFTGYRNDAPHVMSAFDVFCLASRWEGLPVAAMEAAALGLPIVATRVGGLDAAFGDAALLVEPGAHRALADALESVVVDDTRRADMAAASLELAPTFDVAVAVARLEALMEGLVGGSVDVRHPADGTEPPPAASTTPRRLGGVTIRRATPADRDEILALCRTGLGWGDDSRFERLFGWKHDQNAFGPSAMWVAVDGARIVGMRAFMRWEFVRDGAVLSAVRAVDTVTHPDARGRGIFSALNAHALDQVRDDGADFVFNTPNAASLPGYLSLGWREVGRIPANVLFRTPASPYGLATNRTAAAHWPAAVDEFLAATEPWEPGRGASLADASERSRAAAVGQLRTRRSADFFEWRYGLTDLGYRVIATDDGDIVARLRTRGRQRELVVLDAPGVDVEALDAAIRRTLRTARCDHGLRLGPSNLAGGALPTIGLGPLLTWRAVAPMAMPVRSAWDLVMGDVELL